MTENFYLDDCGIHFIYNPYEIDCYAAGTIDIFVPWKSKRIPLLPAGSGGKRETDLPSIFSNCSFLRYFFCFPYCFFLRIGI